jgi:hypothetical protein
MGEEKEREICSTEEVTSQLSKEEATCRKSRGMACVRKAMRRYSFSTGREEVAEAAS